jgi:hypothetical protein
MGVRHAVLGLLLGGCYQPAFPSGAACAVDADCPGGQPCVGNVCGGSARPDAPPDAAVTPDAPLDPDAPLPPPVTFTIGDTADEVFDTELLEGQNTPIGDLDHNSVDTDDHALIRFNLTQIASGTVLSAELVIRTFDEASEDGGTVLVHRMREAWSEDTATFVNRIDTTPWTGGPGAAPPSRDAVSIASFAPNAINTDYRVALPNDMVQAWIDEPSINFGIIIVRGTSTQHVHFRTRENAPSARLIVEVQP